MTKPIAGVAVRVSDGQSIDITSDKPVECEHPFHQTGKGGTKLTAVPNQPWAFTHCPVEGCAATDALHDVLFGKEDDD
jgi:hypothetical protein